MTAHETKTLALELKRGGAAGEFVATFSRFNVIDHDGDVTRPGAFEDGKAVLVGAYQHATSNLPPSGMASRALMQRFIRICSTWRGST